MAILSFRRKMRSFSVRLLFTSLQRGPDKPTNAPVLVYNLNGTAIMLQIVMVSPGTPEPTSPNSTRNNEALGLYVTRQLIWRQTAKLCITVYWIEIFSFQSQAQQRLKEICVVNQQRQKSHKQDILQKHLQIDQSIFAFYGTHITHYFCVFGDFYASGTQKSEVTKSQMV